MEFVELRLGCGVLADQCGLGDRDLQPQLTLDRCVDQRPRFGERVEFEIGHRSSFEHLDGLGRRTGECGVEITVGLGQRVERQPVDVVGKQVLDQPRCNRIPILHQHGQHPELGVLPSDGRAPGLDA